MGENKKKSESKETKGDGHSSKDSKWFSKDDMGELAKLGSDVLKKTLLSGLDVLKDVKDNLPKEAAQMITKKKDDILKNVGKDASSNLIEFAVEKLFDVSKNYTLELSLRLKKTEDVVNKDKKK